jgi:hypothetical protein
MPVVVYGVSSAISGRHAELSDSIDRQHILHVPPNRHNG